MFKLGITGGMGSGKSTAAHYFKHKGATIFDADEEAKRHLLSHVDLQHRIIDTFGPHVTEKNRLDLLKLAEYIFSHKQYHDTLNKIIWPEVYALIQSASEKAACNNTDLFVVDAALLLEAGYTDFFNSILLITAQKSIRIQRIRLRKNIPEEQIEKRMALQMPESEKKKLAQTIIENNEDVQELYMKLEKFYNKLNIGRTKPPNMV